MDNLTKENVFHGYLVIVKNSVVEIITKNKKFFNSISIFLNKRLTTTRMETLPESFS